MVLVLSFVVWLLIGYGILRLQICDEGLRFQGSLDVDVEIVEGPELPVRWCYKLPIKLFHFLVLALVAGTFMWLLDTSYFDLWFYQGLGFYVKNVFNIRDSLIISPLLRVYYFVSLILLFAFISSVTIYFVRAIIRMLFPRYYVFHQSKSEEGGIFTRQISYVYLVLALAASLVAIYYNFISFFIPVMVVFPFILVIFVMQKFLRFIGVAGRASLLNGSILKAAFKQWLFLGLVICAGLYLSPIYVLTDKSFIAAIFNEMKEISWPDMNDLELRVNQSQSGASSRSGFDEDRYSVSANVSSMPDLDLELYSFESKDILTKIVDTFKSKAVPIKCQVDDSLDAVLGGVDLSKLDNSERNKFEILSYINETCKK